MPSEGTEVELVDAGRVKHELFFDRGEKLAVYEDRAAACGAAVGGCGGLGGFGLLRGEGLPAR